MSHMLDWNLFGDNAGGHHWTSVIIHILNAVLLFLFFQYLPELYGKAHLSRHYLLFTRSCRVCGLDSGEEECAEHFFLDTDYVFICLVCKVTLLGKGICRCFFVLLWGLWLADAGDASFVLLLFRLLAAKIAR